MWNHFNAFLVSAFWFIATLFSALLHSVFVISTGQASGTISVTGELSQMVSTFLNGYSAVFQLLFGWTENLIHERIWSLEAIDELIFGFMVSIIILPLYRLVLILMPKLKNVYRFTLLNIYFSFWLIGLCIILLVPLGLNFGFSPSHDDLDNLDKYTVLIAAALCYYFSSYLFISLSRFIHKERQYRFSMRHYYIYFSTPVGALFFLIGLPSLFELGEIKFTW